MEIRKKFEMSTNENMTYPKVYDENKAILQEKA